MSRLLFENSKFALGFAGITLGAAALFAAFGSDTFAGVAENDTPPKIAAKSPAPKPAASPTPTFEDEPEIGDYVADENLVDDAQGFDPTPQEGTETAELADDDAGDNSGGGNSAASKASAAPREPRLRPAAPRTTSVTASRTTADGGSERVEVGIAPGRGGNVSISKDVKIKLK
jgi:hypothetical protein